MPWLAWHRTQCHQQAPSAACSLPPAVVVRPQRCSSATAVCPSPTIRAHLRTQMAAIRTLGSPLAATLPANDRTRCALSPGAGAAGIHAASAHLSRMPSIHHIAASPRFEGRRPHNQLPAARCPSPALSGQSVAVHAALSRGSAPRGEPSQTGAAEANTVPCAFAGPLRPALMSVHSQQPDHGQPQRVRLWDLANNFGALALSAAWAAWAADPLLQNAGQAPRCLKDGGLARGQLAAARYTPPPAACCLPRFNACVLPPLCRPPPTRRDGRQPSTRCACVRAACRSLILASPADPNTPR